MNLYERSDPVADPKIVPLDVRQGAGQPPAVAITWPTDGSAPTAVPGATTAPPAAPNVASKRPK